MSTKGVTLIKFEIVRNGKRRREIYMDSDRINDLLNERELSVGDWLRGMLEDQRYESGVTDRPDVAEAENKGEW